MQINLLRNIVEETAGKQASEVLDLLDGKKDVNEFLIAKKLKLTINQVRNIFYKLSNFGLVSFTRKKDKRKGWYTYFWTLNTGKSLELLNKRIGSEIEHLQHLIQSRKTKRFFICKTCNTEVGEETALLHDFVCPECGEVYVLNEDKEMIEELNKKLARLDKQRKDVLEELGKIHEIKKKKIEKQDRKIAREKAKKRKKSMAKAKRARAKTMKLKGKVKKKAKKKRI